jgi:hypothetical protein
MDIERNARTQVLYREVNDRIQAIQERFGMLPSIAYMCECGRACNLRVDVAAADYARVRDVSTYFLITPDHLASEVDRVVEAHDSWLLVEAVGVAADIARNSYAH